ncbi:hypothetical protein Aduo_007916 [Ancylostoma duodenale]
MRLKYCRRDIRLEIALRMVDHEVALPYWDPTLDYELSDPRYSVLWSEELMGERDYDEFVRRSPLKSWTTHDCSNPGYWSAIEYIGSDPQLFVGGDMENFLTASNDPLFWSLHAMIDLIWQRWRNLYQTTVSDRESQYPANDTTCSGPAHFRDSPIVPFNNFRIIDGFSNNYTREYETLLNDFATLIMRP